MALAVAQGRTVDELSHRVNSAKDTIVSTTKEVTDAARTAAQAARGAAQTAIAVKKAADDSGVTDALINAGKGAVKSGIDRLASRTANAAAEDGHAQNMAAHVKLPPAVVTAEHTVAPPASAPPPKQLPSHRHVKRHAVHIDPAVMRGVAMCTAALLVLVGAACSMRYFKVQKAMAAHNATTLASLQPIYANPTLEPASSTLKSQPAEDEGFEFVEAMSPADSKNPLTLTATDTHTAVSADK